MHRGQCLVDKSTEKNEGLKGKSVLPTEEKVTNHIGLPMISENIVYLGENREHPISTSPYLFPTSPETCSKSAWTIYLMQVLPSYISQLWHWKFEASWILQIFLHFQIREIFGFQGSKRNLSPKGSIPKVSEQTIPHTQGLESKFAY